MPRFTERIADIAGPVDIEKKKRKKEKTEI